MQKQFMGVAALGAALAIGDASHAQAVQWRVEDGGNGHWYAQVVFGDFRTYPYAKQLCSDRGGHPVTITSSGEQGIVCGVMNVLTAWTGAERSESGWGWCTGEPWSYGSICSPTPGGDRVQLYGCSCWNDTVDGDVCHGVIIEWSADCNNDGIVDYGQILQGQLPDTNNNGVPDSCEVLTCANADLFRDSNINGADLGILLAQWGEANAQTVSDINRDGAVDGVDLGLLLSFWGPCPD